MCGSGFGIGVTEYTIILQKLTPCVIGAENREEYVAVEAGVLQLISCAVHRGIGVIQPIEIK